SLTLAAQTATGASNNGGLLILTGGDSTNGTPGRTGGVRIRLAQAAASQNMIECIDLAASRRVLSLCRQINTTTTDMPANTGDFVAFLSNAATNPTANPVNGTILYSNAAFCVRDSSGNCSLGDASIPVVLNGTTVSLKVSGTVRLSADGTGLAFYNGTP